MVKPLGGMALAIVVLAVATALPAAAQDDDGVRTEVATTLVVDPAAGA